MAKYTTHESLAINITHDVKREEYLDYMTFQANSRPLFTEPFGPLIGLKEEWVEQGATPEELDLSAFRFRSPMQAGIPINTGYMGQYRNEIVEETDEYIIRLDSLGRHVKLMKGYATLPLPLDYPVKCMDDWLKIKPQYQFSEERLLGDWKTIANKNLQAGYASFVSIPGGFDEPRQLIGEEELCVSYYTQPELIHDILETVGDTAFKVLDAVSSVVQVDELCVHEDMAGKSGSLAGPKQIQEFIKPYYRKIWDLLQSRGARLFSQDSDGNMNGVLTDFIDAGLNYTYPMEPAAGMDIVKTREIYGTRLAFQGGIDKHILRRSKDEILRELEYKVPPMVKTGGCLLGLDHRIPNGTPLENYRFYISKMWEILEETKL